MPFTKTPAYLIAFTAACAVCGLFTAYNSGFEPSTYWPFYRGVLPFCVLLAAVKVRPIWLIPISAVGCLLSWRLAFLTMALLGSVLNDNGSLFMRMLYWAGTGLMGALGLAASIGLGVRHIFRPKYFFGIGIVGMLTALLFTAASSIGLFLCFAAWQAAVGLAIFQFAKIPSPSSPNATTGR